LGWLGDDERCVYRLDLDAVLTPVGGVVGVDGVGRHAHQDERDDPYHQHDHNTP
jgi:hypothetical protein